MRYKSITWLKAIAALLILNSHSAKLYPGALSRLSFGGLFGNMLFFLISGFCLVEIKEPFLEFMKKRVIRIYLPYILLLPFLFFAGSLAGKTLMDVVFPIKGYHFLPTIITLYPLFYFVAKVEKKRKVSLIGAFVFVTLVQLIYYFLFFDFSYSMVEHYKLIPMIAYFQSMLIGGLLKKEMTKQTNLAVNLFAAIFFFVLYVFCSVRPFEGYWQIAQLYIALGFVYCFSKAIICLEHKLPDSAIVDLVSNLTLEIYLTQFIIIGAYKTVGFPTNIVFCYISVVAVSYCLNLATKKVLALTKQNRHSVECAAIDNHVNFHR